MGCRLDEELLTPGIPSVSADGTPRDGPLPCMQPSVSPRAPARVGDNSPVLAVTYNLERSLSRAGWCPPREVSGLAAKRVYPRKQPGSSEIGEGLGCSVFPEVTNQPICILPLPETIRVCR